MIKMRGILNLLLKRKQKKRKRDYKKKAFKRNHLRKIRWNKKISRRLNKAISLPEDLSSNNKNNQLNNNSNNNNKSKIRIKFKPDTVVKNSLNKLNSSNNYKIRANKNKMCDYWKKE